MVFTIHSSSFDALSAKHTKNHINAAIWVLIIQCFENIWFESNSKVSI